MKAQQPARPQTMVLARKISMQGGTSRDDAKSHLEVEVEDAAVESEEQNDGCRGIVAGARDAAAPNVL